jgi:ACT domain-containing protein
MLSKRQRNQYDAVNDIYINKYKSLEKACGDVGISKATYYRLKNKFDDTKSNLKQIGGNKNVTSIIENEQNDDDTGTIYDAIKAGIRSREIRRA